MKKVSRSRQSLACRVCRNLYLHEVDGFASLCRITSDCRSFPAGGRLAVCEICGTVQKIPDEEWIQEIGKIYAEYTTYYQADGDEQIVFDFHSGSTRRRSDVLMERLSGNCRLPKKGSALDIGCGNGATLLSMSRVFNGWSLNGFDLNEGSLRRLNSIPGFTRLYTGSLSLIGRSFDLTTMIHSLEHFPDPLTVLESLHPVVNSGRLFIEVCNLEENPFDILIADHLMHFSPASILHTLRKAGFTAEKLYIDWVQKEISLTAYSTDAEETPVPVMTNHYESESDVIYNHMVSYINWLKALVDEAASLSDVCQSFGLFGTSIASTWLASQLGQKVSFFVDEDLSRVGKMHMGRPVLSPAKVAAGSTVYISLAPKIAGAIALRLDHLPFTSIMPPPLEFN